MHDQDGGFQRLFEDFMNDEVNTTNVFLNTEVVLIDYSESVSTENPGYNAKVHVAGRSAPILCKRVISTLSVGILEEKKDTLFSPAIETDLMPLEMMQYIKIFFQFQNKFWGHEEFILALNNDSAKSGHCELFQNMATTEYNTEDSNILFCTIITESYLDLSWKGTVLYQKVHSILFCSHWPRSLGLTSQSPWICTTLRGITTKTQAMDHMPIGRFSPIKLGRKMSRLTSIFSEVGDLTIIMCHWVGTLQPMDTRVMNGFCT